MRRRGFLGAAAAGWAALTAPAWLRPEGTKFGPAVADAARRRRFRRKLPIPRVLTGENITIHIRRANVRALPGRKTKMWTYGGTFPGPTIRRPAGSPTAVTFVHDLPRSAGRLSTHLHGGHNPAAADGYPGGRAGDQPDGFFCDLDDPQGSAQSGNELLIAPGEQRTYAYPLTEDGEPERAAFQWYHDHRCDNTARNVYRGLAGMFILDDDFEQDEGINFPSGARDIPLMLADRSFTRRNGLRNPFRYPASPPLDTVTGERILVNGAHRPRHRVKARRYRLRILNASNFRSYNLSISGGVKMTRIATESGLIQKPERCSKLFVAPGERAEVIVDFRGKRGRRLRLVSSSKGVSRSFAGPLMEFQVADKPAPDATTDPAALDALRPLPDWAIPALAGAADDPSFTWATGLDSSNPSKRRWTINGESFDPDVVQTTAERGETVVWRVKNPAGSAAPHAMHLHGADWVTLKRNGKAVPQSQWRLKETFFLDPGESIVIAGKLTDHLGKFIVHCHMLDHEDHGLMAQYEVVPPGP